MSLGIANESTSSLAQIIRDQCTQNVICHLCHSYPDKMKSQSPISSKSRSPTSSIRINESPRYHDLWATFLFVISTIAYLAIAAFGILIYISSQ